MRRLFALLPALLLALQLAACATSAAPPVPQRASIVARADHHQHLFSAPIIALIAPAPGPDALREIPVTELISLLDSAGIRRAAVMSTAYMYGRPSRVIADEYAKVRAENDWTAAQVAKYPDRLRAFCGFNPLKDYALAELERCAAHPQLRTGIKMHFGNSDIQLENPAHIARLKEVFRAANRHHMAIAIHLRASISLKRPYGAAQARAFLEHLMPEVPDTMVQIAHFAGSGPGYEDPPANEVMRTFAEAAARKDPHTRNLYFDVASIAHPSNTPEQSREMVERIRMVGLDKVLYGSDAATPTNLKPREAWAAFRALPLSDAELQRIADNVAPYLR